MGTNMIILIMDVIFKKVSLFSFLALLKKESPGEVYFALVKLFK